METIKNAYQYYIQSDGTEDNLKELGSSLLLLSKLPGYTFLDSNSIEKKAGELNIVLSNHINLLQNARKIN